MIRLWVAITSASVIMGTAAPLNDFVFEWQQTFKILPPTDHPGFYGDTMRSLLLGGDR